MQINVYLFSSIRNVSVIFLKMPLKYFKNNYALAMHETLTLIKSDSIVSCLCAHQDILFHLHSHEKRRT